MNTLWIGLRCLAVILLLSGAAPQSRAHSMSGSMAMMMATDAPTVPAVTGYFEGQEILVIHPEHSHPGIANMLTD